MKYSLTRRTTVGLPCGHSTHTLDTVANEEVTSISTRTNFAFVHTVECKQCHASFVVKQFTECSLYDSQEMKERKVVRIVDNDIEKTFIIPILELFRKAQKNRKEIERTSDLSAIAAMKTVLDFYRIPDKNPHYRDLLLWKIHSMLEVEASCEAIIAELKVHANYIDFEFYKAETPVLPSSFKCLP